MQKGHFYTVKKTFTGPPIYRVPSFTVHHFVPPKYCVYKQTSVNPPPFTVLPICRAFSLPPRGMVNGRGLL